MSQEEAYVKIILYCVNSKDRLDYLAIANKLQT